MAQAPGRSGLNGTAGMPADGRTHHGRLLFGFWLLVSLLYSARVIFLLTHGHPLFTDTDDAMRMVVVRDFLNGQNWFDHVVPRLDTPYGGVIHWSRLVDLPIATLILIVRPFAGGMAETIAAFIWPLLLMLAMLALSMQLTLRLVGPKGVLPGLALPALAAPILAEFSPGRVDHHSVQIILTLALALATIAALEKPRWAMAAGFLAATSLAIGTETLPLVAAAVLAFGLSWVFAPRHGKTLALFGLSFGAFSALHLALAQPPSAWFIPACDALSISYVALAVGTGIAFCLLAALPLARAHVAMRLAAGAILGVALLAALLALFPQCLAGPYAALDPWLKANWLDRIGEAKPVWQSFAAMPGYTFGALLPPLLGLVVLVIILRRLPLERRAPWLVLGLFLLLAFLVALLQIRGTRLCALFAVPPAAWLIVAARETYLRSGKLGPALLLVLAWLDFAGMAQALAIENLFPSAESRNTAAAAETTDAAKAPPPIRDSCLADAAFADLAGFPPERIMAPIDLGAHILWETQHAVVAAPYHRAQRGIIDALNFFNRPIEEARSILTRRDISLVVTCPYLPEMQGFPDAAPDSFVRLEAEDRLPAWLHEVSPTGAVLRVYAVTPQ